MEYNEELLKVIEQYAGVLTSIQDIAVLLDLDEDQLKMDIMDKHSEVSKRYRKAKAHIHMELRLQEIDLAKLGSTIAIEQVHKYATEQQMSEHG